jgi:tetratricopeptide (TPR) repeat protein
MPALPAALQDVLGEHTELVAAHFDSLRNACCDGQKPLLEQLKSIGVTKMGTRQKIAKAIREHVETAQKAPAPISDEPDDTPTPSNDDFWASLVQISEATTAADVDLTAPVALDASQYAEVAPTPRERAALARQARAAAAPAAEPAVAVATAASSAPPAAAADGADSGYDGGASVREQLAAYRERGGVAFGRGDYAAAERWYEKAAALDLGGGGATASAGDGTMDAEHATVLTNLAACALQKTDADPRLALRRLRPVLAALPTHVKARLRAGRCCVMLGELTAAQTHYEVALRAEKPPTPKEGVREAHRLQPTRTEPPRPVPPHPDPHPEARGEQRGASP